MAAASARALQVLWAEVERSSGHAVFVGSAEDPRRLREVSMRRWRRSRPFERRRLPGIVSGNAAAPADGQIDDEDQLKDAEHPRRPALHDVPVLQLLAVRVADAAVVEPAI